MQLGGAGDRHNPRFLREQPGERDLRRRRLLLLTDSLEQLNERLILLHRFRREAWEILAKIVVTELGVLGHGTCQEAFAQRAVAHQADAEFLARCENAIGLRPARPQRILILQRRDRLHRMGAADSLCAGLRQPEMFHLALADELLDRARHVLDWHIEIDAMLVEQVDDLDAEPLQRRVADLADVLGPAIHAGIFACLGIDHEAELGGDYHLVTHGF